MKKGKRYTALLEKVDLKKAYPLRDAVEKVKELASAKFDETVEIHMKLGVDPRKSDQMVRGGVDLPHGTGKTVRVLAFASGEKVKETEEAGADYVGGDDMIEKIQKGWSDFDAVVATPDMMPKIGKIGKILGPKGLMPSPKNGTVTQDIGNAVKAMKKGKVTFRVDRTGVIHGPVGKVSFEPEKLYENAVEFIKEVWRLKPQSAKGEYFKSIYIAPTMGPGIKIDVADVKNNILK